MSENELDRLRVMLRREGIPFENIMEPMSQRRKMWSSSEMGKEFYGDAAEWYRNQIVYGRDEKHPDKWLFDGIWQYGSYGAKHGLIETYGKLGVDSKFNPQVMTAEEAFEIIRADWEKRRAKRK